MMRRSEARGSSVHEPSAAATSITVDTAMHGQEFTLSPPGKHKETTFSACIRSLSNYRIVSILAFRIEK